MDFHLYFYNPDNKYQVNRYYYVLPENKKLITFYLDYYSNIYDFPTHVNLNDQPITSIKTSDTHKYYYYTTNIIGDYQFSFQLQNSNKITVNDIVYVRKSIYDFFEKIGYEKKCLYYTKSTKFYLEPKQIMNLNKICIKSNEDQFKYCQYNDKKKNKYIDFEKKSFGNSYYTLNLDISLKLQEKMYKLYEDSLTFTKVLVPPTTYSFKYIVLTLYCYLDNFYIGKNLKDKINLICYRKLISNQLFCEIEKIITFGKYYIYHFNKIVGSTYLSVPINEANFYFNIQETHIGKNTIIITTDNFSMESIIKIIIRDNHKEYLFYKKNYYNHIITILNYFIY